jgi:hypothetical protein
VRSLKVFDLSGKSLQGNMSLFSAFWHKTSAENRFAAQVLCIQLLKALQHETSDNVVGNPNLLSA